MVPETVVRFETQIEDHFISLFRELPQQLAKSVGPFLFPEGLLIPTREGRGGPRKLRDCPVTGNTGIDERVTNHVAGMPDVV